MFAIASCNLSGKFVTYKKPTSNFLKLMWSPWNGRWGGAENAGMENAAPETVGKNGTNLSDW